MEGIRSFDKLQGGREAEVLRLPGTTPAQMLTLPFRLMPSLGPPSEAVFDPTVGPVVGKVRFRPVLELSGRPGEALASPTLTPWSGSKKGFGPDMRQRREERGGSLGLKVAGKGEERSEICCTPTVFQSFSITISFFLIT